MIRSHDAVIRVYDDSGNVIETHEHKSEFQRVVTDSPVFATTGNGKSILACRNSSPGVVLITEGD